MCKLVCNCLNFIFSVRLYVSANKQTNLHNYFFLNIL
jgi:hypothetical protein